VLFATWDPGFSLSRERSSSGCFLPHPSSQTRKWHESFFCVGREMIPRIYGRSPLASMLCPVKAAGKLKRAFSEPKGFSLFGRLFPYGSFLLFCPPSSVQLTPSCVAESRRQQSVFPHFCCLRDPGPVSLDGPLLADPTGYARRHVSPGLGANILDGLPFSPPLSLPGFVLESSLLLFVRGGMRRSPVPWEGEVSELIE